MNVLYKLKKKNGFTLVELLLATFVLVTGLVGILSLLINCMFLSDSNRCTFIALGHAQVAMEDIKNYGYANITNTSAGWNISTSAGFTAKGLTSLTNESIFVSTGSNSTDPRNVSVSVAWDDRWLTGLRGRSVVLQTSITSL